MAQKRKPTPPPVVNAAATPDVKAIPPLQTVRRPVCGNCGKKALWAYAWQEWRYYRCAADTICVDPETMKPWITKVRAV